MWEIPEMAGWFPLKSVISFPVAMNFLSCAIRIIPILFPYNDALDFLEIWLFPASYDFLSCNYSFNFLSCNHSFNFLSWAVIVSCDHNEISAQPCTFLECDWGKVVAGFVEMQFNLYRNFGDRGIELGWFGKLAIQVHVRWHRAGMVWQASDTGACSLGLAHVGTTETTKGTGTTKRIGRIRKQFRLFK